MSDISSQYVALAALRHFYMRQGISAGDARDVVERAKRNGYEKVVPITALRSLCGEGIDIESLMRHANSDPELIKITQQVMSGRW
jgi:hypothetical protein